jgi:hypothetical protein
VAIGNPILVSGLAANAGTELCTPDFVAGRRVLPAGTRNGATSIGPDGTGCTVESAKIPINRGKPVVAMDHPALAVKGATLGDVQLRSNLLNAGTATRGA